MITFRNVVGYLETIADKHYEINSFHSGFLDEVDINKLGATDYVILYAEPGTAVIDKGVLTYNFTIYVLDMINEAVGDSPNNERLGRVDTLSENLQIMQDVINEFHQNLHPDLSWVDSEVVLNLPINAEPFTARFDNLLTGWSATISMQVNNKNNLCISPIDPND
jgi:hypothetical protein|tara:strand:+ start:653 stop:1147 length:495 start_codon:yes stop_codon:yes gene_type:complete